MMDSSIIPPSSTPHFSLVFIHLTRIFLSVFHLSECLSVSVKRSYSLPLLNGSGSTGQAPTAVTYLVQGLLSQARRDCACPSVPLLPIHSDLSGSSSLVAKCVFMCVSATLCGNVYVLDKASGRAHFDLCSSLFSHLAVDHFCCLIFMDSDRLKLFFLDLSFCLLF